MIIVENTKYREYTPRRSRFATLRGRHEVPLKFSWLLVFVLVAISVLPLAAEAASLTFVSDTISTSRAGVGADHTIRFTATNLVPVSGKIVITPQAGAFTIPSGLDYTDIDLLISGVQNSLGLTPSVVQSGVTVEGGVTPRITITLSSSTFVPPASNIIIKIGKNAAYEIIGDQQIVNPAPVGSYKIAVETRNVSDAPIDTAFGMIAIANPVSVGTGVSQAAMSATFSFTAGGSVTLTNINNSTVVFSFPQDFYTEDLRLQANSYANNFFTTDKPAPSGKSFAGKNYDFNLFTASGSIVSATSKPITMVFGYTDADISGLDESTLAPYRWSVSDSAWQLISGGTLDTTNNKVTFPTALFSSFALFASPAPPPPPPSAPAGGGGGGFIPSPPELQEVITGIGMVVIGPSLKGSTILQNIDGSSASISLDAGSVVQSTEIRITPLAKGTVISVAPVPSGIDIPGGLVYSLSASAGGMQVSELLKPATVTLRYTDANVFGFNESTLKMYHLISAQNKWIPLELSSVDPIKNTVTAQTQSFSLFAIMGERIISKVRPGDFNNDGKVDLVDFSILLYNWGVPKNSTTDINQDGKVDLVDFSILLYWWTG